MQTALGFIPSEMLDSFCQVTRALAFGLAAVWLTATHLASKVRILTSLNMLAVLAGFGLLAYITGQDWSEAASQQFVAPVFLGVLALAIVTALSLAGLVCRRRFQPLRLLFWMLVWLAAVFAVIMLPFGLLAFFTSGGEVWIELGGAILVGTLVGFAVVLPFLLLAFANGLYRERFRHLLRLELASPPPLLAASPSPAPAA